MHPPPAARPPVRALTLLRLAPKEAARKHRHDTHVDEQCDAQRQRRLDVVVDDALQAAPRRAHPVGIAAVVGVVAAPGCSWFGVSVSISISSCIVVVIATASGGVSVHVPAVHQRRVKEEVMPAWRA